MDKLGGARTLEEIEGELMFGTLPESDDDNGLELDSASEIDAINDETFGGEVPANDAELEDYAQQTASLRLDDPVWNSSGGLAEPDASQIPMPVFDTSTFDSLNFGTSPLNSMLAGNFAKGWASSNGIFNLWGDSVPEEKAEGQQQQQQQQQPGSSSIFGELAGKATNTKEITDPLASQLLDATRYGLFGDVAAPSSSGTIQKPTWKKTEKREEHKEDRSAELKKSHDAALSTVFPQQRTLEGYSDTQRRTEDLFEPQMAALPNFTAELQPSVSSGPSLAPAKPPPLPPQAMSAEELERQLLQQSVQSTAVAADSQSSSAARIFDLLMPKNIPSTSTKQPSVSTQLSQISPIPTGQLLPPQLAAALQAQGQLPHPIPPATMPPIPGMAPPETQVPSGGTQMGPPLIKPGQGQGQPPPGVMPPLPMVLPPQAPPQAHSYMATLPPLAALPPAFAQLVPIWLMRLTGRQQHLPPQCPPIPHVIGQMYESVKDPQAVLAIVHVLINRGMALQVMAQRQQQQQQQGKDAGSNGPSGGQAPLRPPFIGSNGMPLLPPEVLAQMRAQGIQPPMLFGGHQQQHGFSAMPQHLQRSQAQTPTSGMQSGRTSAYLRKPPGMPSVRTIEDLALDAYAGYMSFKEKEWLVKIQTLQCQGPTQDPMIEDYYYVLWKQKKLAEGWKPEPKADKPQPPAATTQNSAGKKENINNEIRERYRERCRINGERRREERERERAERRKAKEEAEAATEGGDVVVGPKRESKFAGSLGLPSKSTTNNPRHLIKVGATEMTEEEIARRLASTQKRLRTLLMRLESAMLVLIELQDLRASGNSDSFTQVEASERIDLVLKELFGEELSKVIQISKGRTLISRLLKVAAPKDQARAIIALLSMAKNVRKAAMGDAIADVIPSICTSAAGMSRDQMILILSAINVEQLKTDMAEKNLFARDLLLTLLLVCSRKKASNVSLKLFQWLLGPVTAAIDWTNGWLSPISAWRSLLKLSDSDVVLLVEWLRLLSPEQSSQTIAAHLATTIESVL